MTHWLERDMPSVTPRLEDKSPKPDGSPSGPSAFGSRDCSCCDSAGVCYLFFHNCGDLLQAEKAAFDVSCTALFSTLLTLGAHAQRGLQQLVPKRVCVCYHVFCNDAQRDNKNSDTKTFGATALHWLDFANFIKVLRWRVMACVTANYGNQHGFVLYLDQIHLLCVLSRHHKL